MSLHYRVSRNPHFACQWTQKSIFIGSASLEHTVLEISSLWCHKGNSLLTDTSQVSPPHPQLLCASNKVSLWIYSLVFFVNRGLNCPFLLSKHLKTFFSLPGSRMENADQKILCNIQPLQLLWNFLFYFSRQLNWTEAKLFSMSLSLDPSSVRIPAWLLLKHLLILLSRSQIRVIDFLFSSGPR